MKWECGECGALKIRARRPIRCDECGTVGIFVLAGEENDLEPEGGDLRASWVQAGFDHAAATT